ncbi:TonB-dependent receptor [Telluria mixta]|uniref:TonB-dependent receptor n=1 Tax=Telluria mixta TaxID=34071 RepID=A0ABT2BS36_9BURK|nr:TonB-dependent receptor [Telluria mixta]MCS0627925.1 TonB-dependent receptor [Telluria mixta]WEM93956.1 TonB-dependent receptor [Telluria mixta]
MSNHIRFTQHAIAAAVASLLAGGALAQSGGQIQEVIVTAQRVAQPASKTPLSLSVISGDDLKSAGAVNASSLTELVPNVQIANSGSATVIAIRGVSSADVTEKGDPSAAFNIDGVNLARPQSAGLAFFDLERVEVLRGPQGTLYGRNATAGAINLITNKPGDTFGGNAAVELGNYQTRKFDGAVNVPVNESLALRAAVSSSQHDGYLRSTQGLSHNYDDEDSLSGRVHALFKFNRDVTLLLSADGSKIRGAGPGTVPLTTFRSASGTAQRTATPSVQGNIDDKATGYSAELKANLAIGELTYQGAHRNFDRKELSNYGYGTDTPAPYIDTNAGYSQNSHELRLASVFGAFKTITGLYWFRERSNIDLSLIHFPGLGRLRFVQDPTLSTSKAVFGDATYSVTQDLHLTVGARQTKDDKSRQGFSIIGDPVIASGVNDAAVSYSQNTGKIGADYALSKSSMVYTSLSTGYKAGGFNDGTRATNPFLIYDPEHLTALEVGVKGRFLNGSLTTSAAVFGYDYKNLQLTSTAVDANGAISSQTRNAAKASVRGVELEGKYAVTTNDRINFSMTYLDAHYKQYMPTLTSDWSGRRLDKSPKASVSLGYTRSWTLDSGATIDTTLSTRYTGSYVLSNYSKATQIRQGGFHKTDLTATYSPNAAAWYVQGYVRNIEDKSVMTSYGDSPVDNVGLAPPRTAGIRIGSSF